MWREWMTTGSAAAAIGMLAPSLAHAHGLFWPFARPTWGTDVKVEAVSEPGVPDGCPIESADGRSLFIASGRGGDPNDIWVVDRASVDAPWQAPLKLEAPINQPGIDEVLACRDMLQPAPVRPSPIVRLCARLVAALQRFASNCSLPSLP